MNTELDNNFKEALVLSETSFSHEELVKMLKNGNVAQKQIAALKFDGVFSSEDGKLLVDNLTGCDGKIREAVALKINQILNSQHDLSKYFIYPEIFADATIDINANICRLVVDSVSILSKTNEFSNRYLNKIIEFINNAYAELDNINFRDKKYVINKQLFKLYWCLDALKYFIDKIDQETLYKILSRASTEREYTIREKAAQILIKTDKENYAELKKSLSNDENYYVREVFTSAK